MYKIIDGFDTTLHKSETLEGAKKWKNRFECKNESIKNKIPEKLENRKN